MMWCLVLYYIYEMKREQRETARANPHILHRGRSIKMIKEKILSSKTIF